MPVGQYIARQPKASVAGFGITYMAQAENVARSPKFKLNNKKNYKTNKKLRGNEKVAILNKNC